MRLIFCSLVVVFSAGQLSGCGPSRAQPISNVVSDATTPAPTNPDWSFLVGTTWIVPPSDLNAYQLQGTGAPTGNSPTTSPPTIVRLQDQTVYQITGYENGYFWGVISVTLGVGSAGTSPVVNGTDQWTMENWKFGGYVHWAHMIQTVPGDIYYNNLPYLGTSVTDVLNAPGCASAWRPVSPS